MQRNVASKRPRRAGPRRVVAHIVLFALLGALLLGSGVFGRMELERRTVLMETTLRVDLLLEGSITRIKTALAPEGSDSGLTRLVNNGLSSRKRGLKTQLEAMFHEGQTNAQAADHALDYLFQGVMDRAEEGQAAGLTETFEMAKPGIVQDLAREAQAQVDALTPGDVRVMLAVTEPYYPLMYYYVALLALGVFLLAFAAALLYVYLRSDEEKRARVGERLEPMDYLLPFFIGVALFTLYPIVRVVIMSFQERYKLEGTFTGWGTGNYEYVLQGIPGTTNYFLQGLSNTLLYVLYTVPVSTVLAVIIAYLLNQKLRFSALFQTAYFLPMVTAVTAVGLVWRWIFNQNFGVLNAILMFFGAEPVNWLQQAKNSMAVLTIFGIWSSLPFTIILLLSGLQNIDETYYTVARVDGARAFRIFRRITVPLLAPTIGLVLTINSISAFKVFTEVKVLFGGYPGPVKNMYTMVYYIYDMMYETRELGRAAAAAIVLFLFIFVFTMLQRWIQRRWKYE